MKDMKTWVIGALVLLLAVSYFHEPAPKRPFLNWLGKTFQSLVWVAPFVMDEQPEEKEPRYFVPSEMYSALPVREKGADGHEILEHGESW